MQSVVDISACIRRVIRIVHHFGMRRVVAAISIFFSLRSRLRGNPPKCIRFVRDDEDFSLVDGQCAPNNTFCQPDSLCP